MKFFIKSLLLVAAFALSTQAFAAISVARFQEGVQPDAGYTGCTSALLRYNTCGAGNVPPPTDVQTTTRRVSAPGTPWAMSAATASAN